MNNNFWSPYDCLYDAFRKTSIETSNKLTLYFEISSIRSRRTIYAEFKEEFIGWKTSKH